MFRRMEVASCVVAVVLFTSLFLLVPNSSIGEFVKDSWWPKELLVLILGGIMAGSTGLRIGSWVFSLISRRAHDENVGAFTRAGSAATAGTAGLVAGVVLGALLAFLWSYLIYWHHEERYHGDIDTLGILVLSVALTAGLSFVFGTGLIQSWLKLPGRRNG